MTYPGWADSARRPRGTRSSRRRREGSLWRGGGGIARGCVGGIGFGGLLLGRLCRLCAVLLLVLGIGIGTGVCGEELRHYPITIIVSVGGGIVALSISS